MATKTIRLGVAGAGIAVRDLHWPAIKNLGERFKIVALAAPDSEEQRETGALVGCDNFYEDYKEMIDQERGNLDAVLVALPITMLYEGAAYAAGAGLDVLCEKPVGQDLEDGKKFLALTERSDVTIQILENFRYRDDLCRARALIDEGTIGTLRMVRIQSIQRASPEQGGFAGTEWRQEGDYRGGPLLDSGVHHIAAFHVLAGPVRRVGALALRVSEAYRGVSHTVFMLEFESGAIGEYTFSYDSIEEESHSGFFTARLYGSEGTLIVTDNHIRRLTAEGEAEPETFPRSDHGYFNEFRNFYEHKVEGKPLRVTPQEAFQDLNLILTALDAAEQGRMLEVEN